eukprot:TRINITY_DN10672_c0_g1_i1.p1 TRINITY_DN10672_c0_g1~~TRINITY_DN10672_c0_g1_i1.p1  ORF type:complete len:535 (+),score=113.34 TRINITY_DN10672_c0_g1_i1:161-1765(+)
MVESTWLQDPGVLQSAIDEAAAAVAVECLNDILRDDDRRRLKKTLREAKGLRSAKYVMHLGAFTTGGGRALSLNVDDIPECVRQLFAGEGFGSSAGAAGAAAWDVCTVEWYSSGQYSAGSMRAGEGTDFEPTILMACLQGTVQLVLGRDGTTSVPSDQEGCFESEMLAVLQHNNALMWNWDSSTPGAQLSVCAAPCDRLLVTMRRLRPTVKSQLKPRAMPTSTSAHSNAPTPAQIPEDDSSEGDMHIPAARRTPAIEAEHVRAVYDTIATHWSSTRYKPWPRVAEYLHARCKSGDLIADLGCGNGKYLGCAPQGVVVVGCDASAALLSLCAKTPVGRAAELCTADVVLLPYRDGQFDAAISIAVLHHLSTRQRRLAAAAEMIRVLRPGGTVLVYAWAQEQGEESSRSFSHQDMLVPWHFADSMRRKSADASTERHGGDDDTSTATEKLIDEGNSTPQHDINPPPTTPQQPQHGYRAEGKHSTVFQRYCHLFKEGEVEALFHRVGGCTVVQSYYDCSNWCALVQKDVTEKHDIFE